MLLKAGSMFSVNRIRTSLGDVWTVLPTRGSASLRKACASSSRRTSQNNQKQTDDRAFHLFPPKSGRPDAVWEKIVQIKVQLRDEADVISSARVDGNHRFGADLEIFARPDNAGIDCAGD